MRRSDREITCHDEIIEIIKASDICRLGLSVDNIPYIVPLNFGYKEGCLYFHSAKEGRKLDMIKTNPKVCFEFERDTKLIKAEEACKWTMKYKCVIGLGEASLIEDPILKKEALKIIMNQYTNGKDFEFRENAINAVTVIKVDITSISGKKLGY